MRGKPGQSKVECGAHSAYSTPMDDATVPSIAPAGWLEALAESEAQLAAGQIVSGEEVLRELDECIARLEAKRAARPRRRTAQSR